MSLKGPMSFKRKGPMSFKRPPSDNQRLFKVIHFRQKSVKFTNKDFAPNRFLGQKVTNSPTKILLDFEKSGKNANFLDPSWDPLEPI